MTPEQRKAAAKLKFIETQLDRLEKSVFEAQRILYLAVLDSFMLALEQDKNAVLSNKQNLQLINIIDKIYTEFNYSTHSKLVKTMVNDIQNIIERNMDYFGQFSSLSNKEFNVTTSQVKEITYRRLGLDKNGKLITEGYMNGLLDDTTVKNQIKDYAYRSVLTGSGSTNMKNGLSHLIMGDPERLGAFQRFYRNYAFDTYSQIDAMNGKMYADKLNLRYFTYNGGIIKTTRCFCFNRAGKTYSTDEAKDWDPSTVEECEDKRSKSVSIPANYNFFIDRGSYGCRHSIDYISEELAFRIRPDLANNKETSTERIERHRKIYEKPLAGQYNTTYQNKDGTGVVNEHILRDKQSEDYNDVLYSAKALVETFGGKTNMLPEIHYSEIKSRAKIFPNLDSSKSNPDLYFRDSYLDVKRPESIENIARNANKASAQGAEAVIADIHIELNDAIIEQQAARIFNDKNYTKDRIYFVQKGKIIIKNRTAR